MPRISFYTTNKKKKLALANVEFDRGRIIAYQESRLSFHDIAHCTDRHPTIVMQAWNQWVAEGHTERNAGSQCPPMINAQEDRYIVKSTLENHITTPQTISLEFSMFAACPVSACTVHQCLQQDGLSAL